ncbi:hypothetical protein FKP32DRAFT_1670707 [Trametes sanguinea]|nr:hypothetical protein FKP32DRAFT_1670707 [Trametes sanguinea]
MGIQVEHLEGLTDKSAQDQESITKLHEILKGNSANGTNQRGTLLTMIASMNAERGAASVRPSHHSQQVNLRNLGLYALTYAYARATWAEDVQLLPDRSHLC